MTETLDTSDSSRQSTRTSQKGQHNLINPPSSQAINTESSSQSVARATPLRTTLRSHVFRPNVAGSRRRRLTRMTTLYATMAVVPLLLASCNSLIAKRECPGPLFVRSFLSFDTSSASGVHLWLCKQASKQIFKHIILVTYTPDGPPGIHGKQFVAPGKTLHDSYLFLWY